MIVVASREIEKRNKVIDKECIINKELRFVVEKV